MKLKGEKFLFTSICIRICKDSQAHSQPCKGSQHIHSHHIHHIHIHHSSKHQHQHQPRHQQTSCQVRVPGQTWRHMRCQWGVQLLLGGHSHSSRGHRHHRRHQHQPRHQQTSCR